MGEFVTITATSRYIYVSRADGSLVSRNLTVEDAIESAVNAGLGEYRIQYPDRKVVVSKVYGTVPGSGTPPTTPTDLTIEEVTGGYVSLSWAGDGTSYTVYRDGVPIGTSSGSSYTDSAVVPSTLYSYQVQASNSAGSSDLSAALAATTSANSLPVWSLTDQSGTIGQAFSLNLNTGCDDTDGHALTFTLTSGSVPGLSLVSPNYSGTPTTAGAYPLTFRVSDGYGTSDVSITFNVYDPDVTAPSVPTSVSALANGSTVTVTWTESTDADSGVALYRVYRDGAFRATDTASPYVESGVPVGSYSYTVSAVDSSANANESAQSSAASVTVVPSTPDVPINFTATAVSATQIDLSWAAGPNGTTPDDYDLDWSLTGTSGWNAITFVGTGTTYSHTGRTAGTTYYYRVRAGLGALESGYATANAAVSTSSFPLYALYSALVSNRGGTPVSSSLTRYWDKPAYPTGGTALAEGTTTISAAGTYYVPNGTRTNDITISASNVTLYAQTKHGVTLGAQTRIVCTGSNCNVMGFRLASQTYTAARWAIAIDGSANDCVAAYNWWDGWTGNVAGSERDAAGIGSSGVRNRFCYNTFENQSSPGKCIRVIEAGTVGARYNRIDHNEFLNKNSTHDNTGADYEIIQIGQSQFTVDYYCLVDNNYFYRYAYGNGLVGDGNVMDAEAITVKSAANMFIRNVHEAVNGVLNHRESNDVDVYCSYFIGGGEPNAGGVQIMGSGNRCVGNTFLNLCSGGASTRPVIGLGKGDNSLTGYFPATNSEVAFNTVWNCKRAIVFGQAGSGSIAPSNNRFYNNAIESNAATAITVVLNGSVTYGGNVIEPTVGVSSSGITAERPELTLANGVYSATGSGNCDGTGVTGYTLGYDAHGNALSGAGKDVGAFQAAATANPWQSIIDEAGA